MYKVDVTDHFEDFYVGTHTIGEFNTLREAMDLFCEKIANGYSENGWCLEEYIDENQKSDEDEDIDDCDYSCGFLICVNNDDGEMIAWQHTEYDYKLSHSAEKSGEVEFDSECLTKKEKRILADYGYGTDALMNSEETDGFSNLSKDLDYIIENKSVTVKKYKGGESVIVPREIDGFPVLSIGDSAFCER